MRQESRASELALLFPFKRAKLIIFRYMGMPRGILLSGPGISACALSLTWASAINYTQMPVAWPFGVILRAQAASRSRDGVVGRVYDHSCASLNGFTGCCWHHVAKSVLLPILTRNRQFQAASRRRLQQLPAHKRLTAKSLPPNARITYCSNYSKWYKPSCSAYLSICSCT